MNSSKLFSILQKSSLMRKSDNFLYLRRNFIHRICINKSVSSEFIGIKCFNEFHNNSSTHLSFKDEDKPVEAPPLTKENASSLVMRLTTDERNALMTVLREFEAEQTKAEFKGQLAAFRWRSKFGRPSKMPRLGDVDPTGSYCPVPEDWLLRKYAETIPKPTSNQLFGVAFHNAVPFIGFGFLDNFVMIICGDYIDMTLGSWIAISTMAAAALGNTFSDILGIGSAFYVERAVAKLGLRPPNLSPIQLDMFSSRLAANWGRVFGVTLGCLLGMLPLLFKKEKDDVEKIKPVQSLQGDYSSGQQGTSISVV